MSNRHLEEESFDKKQSGKIFVRLIKLVKPVWGAFVLIGILMIAVAVGEMYYPMVGRNALDQGITPFLILDKVGNAVGEMVNDPNISFTEGLKVQYIGKVWEQVGIFLVIWLSVAICIYSFIRLAGLSSEKIMYLTRKKVFNHLQKLSFSYFDKTQVGWIMTRVTSDIERFSEMLAWHLVDFVWGTATVLIISVAMFVVNWKLALIVVTAVPILFVISLYFRKKILEAQRKVRRYNSEITGSYNEGINGVKIIKSLVQHKRMHGEFQNLSEEYFKNSYKAGKYSAIYIPLIMLISGVVIAIVQIVFGQMYFFDKLNLSVGDLVLFTAYTMSFFEPLNQIAVIFASFQRALASAERVFSLLDADPEIIDETNATDPGDIKGLIEFKNVSFQYEEGKSVLKNFNLRVEPGQTVALVGPTGAGKSTVINLVCRFYEPTQGQIFIDGKDYKERTVHSLHSRLGIVLQTPHLFSGTIKENIRYGKLDATDEEVARAAEIVNADKFIDKLPRTYDEDVGEGGNLLSTGEKQLISFARAAIVNPQIFIMDEATSSVDTLTEKLIQDGINNMLEGKTCFIIAHRLSTIKTADRIIVLKDGEIEEDGTHKELLMRKGHYYKLYTKQLREEKEQELGLVKSDIEEEKAS